MSDDKKFFFFNLSAHSAVSHDLLCMAKGVCELTKNFWQDFFLTFSSAFDVPIVYHSFKLPQSAGVKMRKKKKKGEYRDEGKKL